MLAKEGTNPFLTHRHGFFTNIFELPLNGRKHPPEPALVDILVLGEGDTQFGERRFAQLVHPDFEFFDKGEPALPVVFHLGEPRRLVVADTEKIHHFFCLPAFPR